MTGIAASTGQILGQEATCHRPSHAQHGGDRDDELEGRVAAVAVARARVRRGRVEVAGLHEAVVGEHQEGALGRQRGGQACDLAVEPGLGDLCVLCGSSGSLPRATWALRI